MYIRGLIPRNSRVLGEAVPIEDFSVNLWLFSYPLAFTFVLGAQKNHLIKQLFPLLSTGLTREDRKTSQYDWKLMTET